eukprot:2334102-Alexandrium_andersonii.AAC.1
MGWGGPACGPPPSGQTLRAGPRLHWTSSCSRPSPRPRRRHRPRPRPSSSQPTWGSAACRGPRHAAPSPSLPRSGGSPAPG